MPNFDNSATTQLFNICGLKKTLLCNYEKTIAASVIHNYADAELTTVWTSTVLYVHAFENHRL